MIELLCDHPDERWLLLHLLGTRDDAARQAYRAWLAARGDARAELLDLEDALDARASHEPRGADPGAGVVDLDAKRARVRELLADGRRREWWGAVARVAPIRNCGRSPDEPPRVRFAFACPRTWDDLAPTVDPRVRRCSTCAREVHRCVTAEEAAERAREGQCITVPARIADAEGSATDYTGRVDPVDVWGRRVFGARWDDG